MYFVAQHKGAKAVFVEVKTGLLQFFSFEIPRSTLGNCTTDKLSCVTQLRKLEDQRKSRCVGDNLVHVKDSIAL